MSNSIFSKDERGQMFLLPMKDRNNYSVKNAYGRKFSDRTVVRFLLEVPEDAYKASFEFEGKTPEIAIEAARKIAERLGFNFNVDEEKFYQLNPEITWNLYDSSKEVPKYTYRSLSSMNRAWFVSGVDSQGGAGILEWCDSENDAKERLSIMKNYPQLSSLEIGFFDEPTCDQC